MTPSLDPSLNYHLAAAIDAARPLCGRGRVADYIPALAEVSAQRLGMAVALADGSTHIAGDGDVPFSIQSISKVFVLALVMARQSAGQCVGVWDRVGREASGSAFNSIVQLEDENGRPRNPLINAGAIAVTDLLLETSGEAETAVADLLESLRTLSRDDHVRVDARVARSEAKAGARNRSLAHFLATYDRLDHPVEEVLSVYFRQCAVAMSCRQLARAGLIFANRGVDPETGVQHLSDADTRHINAIMMSCGHYDGSGEFAWRVGLPGKSGVGGGILAVAPGRGALAAWSPGLGKRGTSLAGSAALEAFVEAVGWSVLA